MKSKRLFITIPLSGSLKEFLIDQAVQHALPGKLTPRENLHITVHFLGETDEEALPHLIDEINAVTKNISGFELVMDKIILKKRRGGYMLWAHVCSSESFSDLVKQIRTRLDPERSEGRVSPHITLSRVKKGKADLKENEFPYPFETRPIHVDRIGLWESRLGEGSPVYISHKDFPLE